MTAPGVPQEFDPAWVLFQGSGVLAVNKPAGIPVHRGTSHELGLAEMVDDWVRMNPGVLEIKPGRPVHPVHRLDREASGVLLLGLTLPAARALSDAFAGRGVRKLYLAVVAGPVEALGHLKGKVRSKLRGTYRQMPAELTFRRLAGDERLSLVEVTPLGGRTHQIRALFTRAGRPLAGDLRYGKPKPSRQFLEKFEVPFFLLHARELTLPAGILGAERRIEAPLPAAFLGVLEKKGWTIPELQETA
ncbi:MAG: RNA pseudouridine synthase [Planctomycetes bacterium]|nr:RNA pseudouridine synthase [Planctomycetota bacterium]